MIVCLDKKVENITDNTNDYKEMKQWGKSFV